MAIHSVRCPVLGANVTRITDLEGDTVKVICVEYEETSGACRLKVNAADGGLLAQLVQRVAEDSLYSRSSRCQMR